VRAQREVVVLVAGESRQVEHHHEMHAAPVQPTIREQVLKLASIGGLGAFAFLVEPFKDFVALAAAVLLAGAKLGRQTQVLGLLLRADANVDRSSRQRAIEIGRSSGHSAWSLSHGVGVGDRTAVAPPGGRHGAPPDDDSL
jgi:hypothetical protein